MAVFVGCGSVYAGSADVIRFMPVGTTRCLLAVGGERPTWH